MGILTDIYNKIFKNNTTIINRGNNTRVSRGISTKIDLTFPDTINSCFTKKLWHNTQPGYRLGAQLCYNPIAVPLAFMGFPHFDIADWDKVNNTEFWEERFKYYNEKYILLKQVIQLMCHRDGTIGIFPWYNADDNIVYWKFIKPEYIKDRGIIIDPETEKILSITTSIDYYYIGENQKEYYYNEQRTYTRQKIIINRIGNVPANLRLNLIRNNPTGILPIFFRNNAEPGEFEGHSDYEKLIPHIKAYSEINEEAHKTVGNMKSKLIQEVQDVNEWLSNNGYTNVNDIDVSGIDLIINLFEKEKTTFEVPKNLIDNHILLMKNDFRNIVEGSGIPEIAWGLKTEGNHASAQEQMGILLSFTGQKQNQATPPYFELINATMKLEALANNQTKPENIIITWNDLDSLTEVERSEIFKNISDGFAKLLENYAVDLQTVHKVLYEMTGGKITSDYDDFEKQIKEYGTIKAFLEQEYIDMRLTIPVKEDTGQGQVQKPKEEKDQRNGKKSKNEYILKEI